MGYFRLKAEQEHVIEEGPVPWSIVRATQFHELALATLTAGARWGVLPVPGARLQTVACAEVAPRGGRRRRGRPGKDRMEVAGPEVTGARDLARTWRSVTGRRGRWSRLPVPGKLGRALRAGVLTDRPARHARHHHVRGLAGGPAVTGPGV